MEEMDLAIEWTGRVAGALGVPTMSSGQVEAVLALAGGVAHGTGKRSFAPLTTFLAGFYVARQENDTDLLQVVRDLVERLLEEEAGGVDTPADSAGVDRR